MSRSFTATIYEFALDPALVARWQDPREYAFFREAFGADTGRLGSAYPNEWRRRVLEAFHTAFPGTHRDSLSRQRLEALLDAMLRRMVKREDGCSVYSDWLKAVEAEHAKRPFRGILSLSNPRKCAEVITPDNLFGERLPEVWLVPPNPVPPRTAQELAAAVAPLLKTCRRVVFVDPYFNPDEPRFRNTLAAMLAAFWSDQRCYRDPRAELLLSEGDEKRKRDGNWLLSVCGEKLTRIIPNGRILRISVLRKRPGKEKIHNRYILTELAGISFGVGLDEADEEGHGQTDDLCRLSSVQFAKRWGQYVSDRKSTFEIAAGPKDVVGR